MKPTDPFFKALAQAAGPGNLFTDAADCWAYGYDNSRREAPPDAVVFAASRAQVQAVVRSCFEHRVPLVARGRGTGTCGGAVPTAGGVVLSFERMHRILETNAAERLMVVEPGVTNRAVQDEAARHGLFWPPDPSSAEYCTVGGNLAFNAAGPRAVKYGTARENVLGLRAVTGYGETIRTGVRTTKGVVGYDLTRLLIGSEGTLAVITEATLKLTPLPEARRTLMAAYADVAAATEAIVRIMRSSTAPSALEFIDRHAIAAVRAAGAAGLPEKAGALLLVEIDGAEAALAAGLEALRRAAEDKGLVGMEIARDSQAADELWAMRRALSPALRRIAPDKLNEDVVVPVARIPELLDGLDALSARFRIPIVNFGHAGNGNIHVNLLYDARRAEEVERAATCLDEVFALVLRLGGTLSGEHGIGLVKRGFVARELGEAELALMRAIKDRFDPRGILNPHKLFPDAQRGGRS